MAELKSKQQVADWLAERRNNAVRIAAEKRGADRNGWLEDAAYFAVAIRMILGSQDGAA